MMKKLSSRVKKQSFSNTSQRYNTTIISNNSNAVYGGANPNKMKNKSSYGFNSVKTNRGTFKVF